MCRESAPEFHLFEVEGCEQGVVAAAEHDERTSVQRYAFQYYPGKRARTGRGAVRFCGNVFCIRSRNAGLCRCPWRTFEYVPVCSGIIVTLGENSRPCKFYVGDVYGTPDKGGKVYGCGESAERHQCVHGLRRAGPEQLGAAVSVFETFKPSGRISDAQAVECNIKERETAYDRYGHFAEFQFSVDILSCESVDYPGQYRRRQDNLYGGHQYYAYSDNP